MTLFNEPLVIRADASTKVGTGHVMRCLALAQAWQDAGKTVWFVTASESSGIEARLRAEGMDVTHIASRAGSADDAEHTVDLALSVGAKWIVADGRGFDAAYQRTIKDSGLRFLLVDDNGSGDHYYADIVLNQNIDAHESMYANREPDTRLLLGTRYVMLRREFREWKEWRRKIPRLARNVLLTLGGSDPGNVTLKAIRALRGIEEDLLSAVALVGPNNPHYDELRSAAEGFPSTIRLLTKGADLPELMAWADVAVTAAGITCWELAFMRVPALTVVTADNQRGAARGLSEAGVFHLLGWGAEIVESDLAEELHNLMRDRSRRADMSAKGGRLVDGRGAERVLPMITSQL